MATAGDSAQTESDHGQSYNLDGLSEVELEAFNHLSVNVSKMFDDEDEDETASAWSRGEILKEWVRSNPARREFLQKSVSLYLRFPINQYYLRTQRERQALVEAAGLDNGEFIDWKYEIGERHKDKKNEPFRNISVKRFLECLARANWKGPNLEARVASWYLERDYKEEPDIYLGSIENWPLAVELNGETLLDPEIVFSSNDEGYSFTRRCLGITRDCWRPRILSLRFTPLVPSCTTEEFLFIILGRSENHVPVNNGR
jgi:hypothetical protein